MAPASGAVSGRYRLARLLGEGGMACVYVARDGETDRDIALKRLSPEAGLHAAKLFEREYRTLAGLRHPGIVEVYDYGSDADGPYYTMELVAGSELSTLSPMAWRDACACLRDAAAILGVLHARKLLHRDLSARNLLQLSNGRLKLIDFGALSDFGSDAEVLVGTPPFIAPEALRGVPLDQRSDLFALGALGYWLLTGVHAFPAKRVNDLAAMHGREPAPASQVVALTSAGAGEPVPEELDALLTALLRIDPSERPLNTSELIDRLNAIAELPPEAQEANAQGYLESKVFVGRVRERAVARQLIHEARTGQARALLLEGRSGAGRSRLLLELTIAARMAGVVTLSADARHAEVAFGAATDLALALLKALPEPATRLAKPYVQQLAHASSALAEFFKVRPSTVDQRPGETRARTQNALRDWLMDVCEEHAVALFVDDLHAIDEESQAWFSALIHADKQRCLLLVASVPSDGVRAHAAAVGKFREAASVLELRPLESGETLELLRSMFGPVAFLERCAERLHRASRGNPAHCLELSEYLVRTGVVRYVEGLWELPSELKREQLPRSRQEGHVARIAHLPEQARVVAQQLSIPTSGPLSLAQCIVITGLPSTQTTSALTTLVEEHVLQSLDDGYRFVSEDVRAALYRELSPEERKRVHLTLGRFLDQRAGDNHIAQVRAAVQLLRGGAEARGQQLLQQTTLFYLRGDISTIRVGTPLYEEAYGLLQESRADDAALAPVLTLLAVAGYFVDRRYGVSYGEAALDTLARTLRLPLFYRLKSWLGQKLALVVALLVAFVGLALLGRRTLSLKSVISCYVGAVSALNGMAATCLDPTSCRRYTVLLEPFAWLGAAPRLIHKFCVAMGANEDDHVADNTTRLERVVAELDVDRPIADLPDSMKRNFIAGGLTSIGIFSCWRDGERGLEIAARMDGYGPLYTLYADNLRAVYYANRGEPARAEEYRQLVEMHAVQLGSSWQVETWAPSNALMTALRTHDAMLAKRVAQQMARLSAELPWFKREESIAQGTYLVLRGKYEQAAQLLESPAGTGRETGWMRSRGPLARAYNGLGDHARAHAICTEVLASCTPEDLAYVVLNLSISIELALAEAGLGQLARAREQLDALLAQHAPLEGALTLGALHEARVRVELLAGDFPAAREHLLKMDSYYRPHGVASLIEQFDRLARELQRAENPRARHETTGPWQDGPALLMQLSVYFTNQRHDTLAQRASKALGVARDLVQAQSGFVLLPASDTPLAAIGDEEPDLELCEWAARALLAISTDEQTVVGDDEPLGNDVSSLQRGALTYRMTPLFKTGALEPNACLVLGFTEGPGRLPDPGVLRALAQQMAD